jgi:DNA-binding CsgD family transcriptional regulator
MKGKSSGHRFSETEDLPIDGDTQRSSHDGARNPSRDRDHSGEHFGRRHDRLLVNRQNGRDDSATAAQPPTGEFGETGSRRRPLARDAVRGPITLSCLPRIAELEQELEATRTALQDAVHNLEISREEQKTTSDEASYLNDDHQSMMKELLASRGEVASLKQELAVLKSQMSESLKPQPAASKDLQKDLQNAKHSPAGAKLFLPMSNSDPLASSECHPGGSWNSSALIAWRQTAANHIAGLTQRQREVMELVLAGRPSKNIATDLGISQRTVENHRASIMKKTGSKSLPALTRLAFFAAGNGADGLLLLGGLPVLVLQRRVHS